VQQRPKAQGANAQGARASRTPQQWQAEGVSKAVARRGVEQTQGADVGDASVESLAGDAKEAAHRI